MPEDPGAAGAAGDPNTSPADDGGASGGDPGKEAAYWRRQAEKYKAGEEKLKKQSMTETERLKAELDEERTGRQKAEGELKSGRVNSALEAAAKAAGSHDADTVAVLAAAKGTFDLADDGTILGVEQAIKAIKQAKPHLFGPAPKLGVGSGGGRSTNGGTGDKPGTGSKAMDAMIRKPRR